MLPMNLEDGIMYFVGAPRSASYEILKTDLHPIMFGLVYYTALTQCTAA